MKVRDHNKKYIPKKRKINPFFRIYCEGATEKYYFEAIKSIYRSNNLSINIIVSEKKSAQDNLLDEVKKIITYEQINFKNNKDDSIWCVLDVEENKAYWKNIVIPKIKEFQNKTNKFVIVSNPSFEIWLLLFFIYSTRKYTNKELCDELTSFLKVKSYSRDVKGKNIKKYVSYFSNISLAIKQSKKLIIFHKSQNRNILDYESNPVTQIQDLFIKLENIKK
jgi:hypothetical protein